MDVDHHYFGIISHGYVPSLAPREAKDLLNYSGYTYIDIRKEEEYNKCHVDVPRVLNIPEMVHTRQGWVPNPNFMKEITSRFVKRDRLFLGSKTGAESAPIVSKLIFTHGFLNVINMEGGFDAWLEKGYPLLGYGKPEEEEARDEL
ncbi:Rhodanese domain-containing protein [Melia azedarach]|uniref:Rhodanese domain-containing protein n=1 Tax=Melia azedarach TaxID=155640 RepID=A0ACC1XTC9_MELAZ|nr:Rhodanese domain-containing protein [Melia azedarach]